MVRVISMFLGLALSGCLENGRSSLKLEHVDEAHFDPVGGFIRILGSGQIGKDWRGVEQEGGRISLVVPVTLSSIGCALEVVQAHASGRSLSLGVLGLKEAGAQAYVMTTTGCYRHWSMEAKEIADCELEPELVYADQGS